MPMRTGGSLAIQGIRSCRDKRLRYTTLPLSAIPTACNTRLAISIPRTCISCFIGLVSCGEMVAADSKIIVAHRSRSAQEAGPFHYDRNTTQLCEDLDRCYNHYKSTNVHLYFCMLLNLLR